MGDLPLEGRMIVFVGANSQLALQCASALANEDLVVGLCREAREETRKTYSRVLEMDYRHPDRAVEQLDRMLEGRITFANFAACKIDKLFLNLTSEDVDEALDVNVRLNFAVLPTILRRMMAAKWGRIVFLSSTGAERGDVGLSLYSVGKAGLLGLARVLAKEYGRFGVTTNVLSLGYFDTQMFSNLSEESRARLRSQIPSRKLGDAANIVESIRYLVRSNYVNGAVVPVDGGI